MGLERLAGFLARAEKKPNYRLDKIYFAEESFPERLRMSVNLTKTGERVKICETYVMFRSPERLRTDLASLVTGRGADPAKYFMLHRGTISSLLSSSEPDSAVFVRELLNTYPS